MVDLFETRTMLAIQENIKPVRTFFLNTFFKVSTVFNTEAVDIDIIKGKRRLAPFVNPNAQGKLVERRGFQTRSYKPPYVKPKMVTTAGQLLKRQPGQVIYSPNTSPAIQAAKQMGKDLSEMDELITRRIEWMAAQALITGEVRVIGEGVDDTIGFHMEPSHLPVLSGGALWSEHATALPLDDLKTWKRLVAKDSGKNPNICLMGLAAVDNFLKCEQVIGSTSGKKGLFDLLRINIGEIKPEMLPDGVTYYGRLTELGLDVYTYEEWYVSDDDDVTRPLMPDDKVLLGSERARAEVLYGAIQDLDSLAPVARFPKSWEKKDPSRRFVMTQSAPLPTPIEIDAFLTGTVL